VAKRAQLADGRILEFPDNTPIEVIQRVVKQQIAATQKAAPAPRSEEIAKRRAELQAEARAIEQSRAKALAAVEKRVGKPVEGFFGNKGVYQSTANQFLVPLQQVQEQLNTLAAEEKFIKEKGRTPYKMGFGEKAAETLRAIPRGAIEGVAQLGGLAGTLGPKGEAFAKSIEQGGANVVDTLGLGQSEDVKEALQFDIGARQASQLAGGLGSVVPYAATELLSGGAATPLLLARAARGTQLAMATGQGATQAREQLESFEQETGQQVDPTVRQWVQLGGGAIGLSELVNIGSMVRVLPAPARDAAVRRITQIVADTGAGRLKVGAARAALAETGQLIASQTGGKIITEGFKEAGQEGGAQFAQNVLEQQAYNPEKALSQDVAENAILGGVVGGGIRGLADIAEYRANRKLAAQEGQTPPEPAAPTGAPPPPTPAAAPPTTDMQARTAAYVNVGYSQQYAEEMALADTLREQEELRQAERKAKVQAAPPAQPGAPIEEPRVALQPLTKKAVKTAKDWLRADMELFAEDLIRQPTEAEIDSAAQQLAQDPNVAPLDMLNAVMERSDVTQQAEPVAAPEPVAVPEPVAAPEPVSDLQKMGSGIAGGTGENLRKMLLAKVEAGDTTENGQPSALLQAAKIIKDAGVTVDASMLERIQAGIDSARTTGNFNASMRAFVTDTVQRVKREAAAEPEPEPEPEPMFAAEEEVDYENHPLMAGHNSKFDEYVSSVEDIENVNTVRARARKFIKEGILDESVLDDINEAMDDEEAGYRAETGRDRLIEALDDARVESSYDVESEIDRLLEEGGQPEAPEPEQQAEPEPEPEPEPEDDELSYDAVEEEIASALESGEIDENAATILSNRIRMAYDAMLEGREVRYSPQDVLNSLDLFASSPVTVSAPAPDMVAPEGDPDNESSALNSTIDNVATGIVEDFMVGDRVSAGTSKGTVVGLDGDYVRFHPDSAKNPKAYHRIPKNSLQLVSRPDTASTSSKSADQSTKFGEEQGQLNADMAGLIQLLGANMYASNIAEVSVKELLQNAFDAVKGAVSGRKAPSLYKHGNVEVSIDAEARTITVKDNARGMTPEIVRDAFFTVAGSDKSDLDPSERSGGLGLAKMGFMMGADWLKLDTVRDGVRVTVDATSKEIAGSEFKINKSPAPKGEHGTTVTVKIPETYTDPKTGDQRRIWFPSGASSVGILNEPLVGPVEITVTAKDRWGDTTTETLPLGINFPFDSYQKLTARFDWGTADIYYGKARSRYPRHQVLSSGVYQFNERFMLDMSEQIPYDIVVDVKPNVDAKHPDYPFENSRERFKRRLDKDVKSLGAYLAKIARGAEAADLKETMQNVVSLPRVEAGEDLKGLEGKLKKSFDREEGAPTRELPPLPIDVQINDRGVFDMEGRTVVDESKEAEKKRESSFEADEAAPTRDDFMMELDQDPRNPIFHNNTSFDPIEVGAPYGEPALFFAELGSVLVEMKELLAKSGMWGYDTLAPENMFYAGIGVDKQYGGLHIKVPYKAVLINPFYDWGSRTLAGVRATILNTMIHEIAHTGDMQHGVGHNSNMVRVEQFLADEGMLDYFRDAIMDTLIRHESVFTAMRDEYGRSTTQNVAKSLEDVGKEESSRSASRRTPDGGPNAARSEQAGGGPRGGEAVPAAAGASEPSGKLGAGRRTGKRRVKTEEEVAEANRKIEEKMAGYRAQLATEQSLSGSGLLPPLSESFAEHEVKDKSGFIRRAFENFWRNADYANLRMQLFRLPTRDLVIEAEKLSAAPEAGERAPIRQAYDIHDRAQGLRATLLNAGGRLQEDLNGWVGGDKLSRKYPDAKKRQSALYGALDLMRALAFNPSVHAGLNDALVNDGVVKAIKDKLTNAKRPQEQGKARNQLKEREDMIRRGWAYWEKLGQIPGGHEMFTKIVDYYAALTRATRNEIDGLVRSMQKVLSPEDLAQMTSIINDIESSFDEPSKEVLKGDVFDDIPTRAFPVVYVPWNRFGRYVLQIMPGTKGYPIGARHQYDSIEERETDAKRIAKEVGVDPNDAQVFTRHADPDRAARDDANESTVIRNVLQIIRNADLNVSPANVTDEASRTEAVKALRADLEKQLTEMLLTALPEESIRKQFIRAKGTPGRNTDHARVLAYNVQRYANQLPRLKFGYQLRNALEMAQEEISGEGVEDSRGQEMARILLDEIGGRLQEGLNPPLNNPLIAAFNNFGYTMLLSAPASAINNSIVTWQRAAFELSSEYGPKAAAKLAQLEGVMRLMGTVQDDPTGNVRRFYAPSVLKLPLVKNNPVYAKAFLELRDVYNAFGHGFVNEIVLQSGASSIRPKGVVGYVMDGARKITDIINAPFGAIERITNEKIGMATFMLEYEKQKAAGKTDKEAFDLGVDRARVTVKDAVGAYGQAERPPLFKGVGSLLLLFKSFSLNIAAFIERQFKALLYEPMAAVGDVMRGRIPKKRSVFTKAEKKQATKLLMALYAGNFLWTGVSGMFGYSTIAKMLAPFIFMFMDDDEREEWASENPEYVNNMPGYITEKLIPDTFGGYGNVVAYGPMSALTDVNLSARVGYDNLFFKDPVSKTGNLWNDTTSWFMDNFAAGPGRAADFMKGASAVADGNWEQGAKKMLPAFFGAPTKAAMAYDEGIQDARGRNIIRKEELSTSDLVKLALGYQPLEVSKTYSRLYGSGEQLGAIREQGRKLLRQLRDAEAAGDYDRADEIEEAIDDFNDVYPGSAITEEAKERSRRAFESREKRLYRGVEFKEEDRERIEEDIEEYWAEEDEE